jgi:hypothetical protein
MERSEISIHSSKLLGFVVMGNRYDYFAPGGSFFKNPMNLSNLCQRKKVFHGCFKNPPPLMVVNICFGRLGSNCLSVANRVHMSGFSYFRCTQYI